MSDEMDFTPDSSSWSMPSAPVFTPSQSSAVVISHYKRDPSEQDVSQRMLQLGRSMNIIGPKLISRARYESEALGSGAKFEVYAHKLPEGGEAEDGMLWEGMDVRTLAFKRGKTSLKKPQELDDPSTSWVAVVSESQDSVGDARTDEKKAKQLEQVAAVVREMKALARDSIRHHRNIVKLFAWGFDMEDFNSESLMTPILVEERAWGTFSELLATEKLSVIERFNLCHDALQGLTALHQDGLYHGDINPKNILVYQEQECIVAKISDFSHCGFFPTETGDMVWYQGTKGWQAPEVGDSLPASKADIIALESYSFGLVLWSAMGLGGKSPLVGSSVASPSIPNFARACIEKYSLPSSVLEKVEHTVPRLLHEDRNSRFWITRDILGDKLPVQGRRLILHASTPINLSMDESFQHLDAFIRKRTKKTQLPDLRMGDNVPINPFLRLMVQEAYIRSIDWRLAGGSILPGFQIPAYQAPDPQEYRPPCARPLRRYRFMDPHELEQIDQERKKGKFTSLAAGELFDIAIGFYSYDPERGLLYLRQAASIGDVRAQALYEMLAFKTSSSRAVPADTLQQWAFDAVATGFTISPQSSPTSSTLLAGTQFRSNSGYNCYSYAKESGMRNVQCFHMDLEPMKEYLRSKKFQNTQGQIQLDGDERNTLLHLAALAGDLEVMKTFAERYAQRPWVLNPMNKRNETPLLIAFRSGNVEIVKTLLEVGASANTRDGKESPLHWLFAIPAESMTEVCNLAVSSGRARLNAVAPEIPTLHFPFTLPQGTPLTWAVATGSLPAVQVLSSAIVTHPDLTLEEKQSCFAGAINLAMIRHEADMMKAMLDAAKSQGVNLASVASEAFNWSVIDVPEDSEDIPVAATPLSGDWKDNLVRTLRHGNDPKKLRQTLIHLNSLQSSRVVDVEADAGSNIAASFTYLKQVILQHDSVSTIRLLKRYGSTYTKSDLGTALFLNLEQNWALPSSDRFPIFMDIFRGLINAGADVNMPNPLPHGLGNTLMHIIIRKYTDQSSKSGISEIRGLVFLLLKVLQSCGAEVNRKNMIGLTVMDYALHNQRDYKLDEELVDMLHKWGVKSTFRLLPMSAESRIGNWNTRQLEWAQPEPERVDVRKVGLAIKWDTDNPTKSSSSDDEVGECEGGESEEGKMQDCEEEDGDYEEIVVGVNRTTI
ncbi:hypothetical protein TWF730_002895 [Orbilia blumenaviensis]|uniref:Protein kinase domain-containing protein n=1 Tax=Orbilia blumenaviensis TaxID=1796055 RepID=A0AAV9UBV6_9PEZI